METLLNALPWIVGGLILILLLAALRRPLEWLVRLAARTGVGLAALWALSGVGSAQSSCSAGLFCLNAHSADPSESNRRQTCERRVPFDNIQTSFGAR